MAKSNMKKQVYSVVILGLLVAIEVVISRFLSIRTPVVTIGFGFVPVCLAAIMYGPLAAGIVGGLSDFLGAILFPIGAYFPGFTLTAFLAGVVYGWFLHRKDLSLRHVVLASVIVNLVMNLGLNTVWLAMIMGNGFLALMPARLLKVIVMIPLQIAVLQVINKGVVKRLTSTA